MKSATLQKALVENVRKEKISLTVWTIATCSTKYTPFCVKPYRVQNAVNLRPLENVHLCSSSRKAKILTTGIHRVFRGLKSEPDVEIGQKGAFCKGLNLSNQRRNL